MAVPIQSETRLYGRILEHVRDRILPGIMDQHFNAHPLLSSFTGRAAAAMFGAVGQGGRGKETYGGGASLEKKVNVGENETIRSLAGGFDLFDTTPQDTKRHSRANWKLYGGTVAISKSERRQAQGELQIANLVQSEMETGVSSLLNRISQDLYDNGGIPDRISDLDTLIGAGAGTVQLLSGTTYPDWNSRGLSVRGTAPASVSFTGGSFAGQGIDDWRLAWWNAVEGNVKPQGIYTTHAIANFYEGSLQVQERFTDTRLADAGFQQIQFNTAPVFRDDHCPSGLTYFVNFDYLKLATLAGGDFSMGDFIEPADQEAEVAKLVFHGQLWTIGRKFSNKISAQTA